MTIAWVTGGGTGIGRALAEALYRQGARVVISGRRQDVLEQAAREISAGSSLGEILPITGNAADPSHAGRVADEVKSRWGAIDLLINNAGSNDNRSLKATTAEGYREAFENNVLSAIHAAQAVLPGMLAARHGAIINISSIYGRMPSSNSASYTVSKHALAGYTDVLRQGLFGTGIHVMGVYPGFIRTAMTLPFVRRGSIRSQMGKTPEQMADAILKALRKKKRDLNYPWYVPWAFRLNRWFPTLAERMSQKVKK